MIIFKDLSLDCFFLSETKLDESFPTAQFALEGYKIGSRNYRGKYGGDLSSNLLKMVLFVKQYLSTYLTKLNAFVQNSPFQRISGFISVYTDHPYQVT